MFFVFGANYSMVCNVSVYLVWCRALCIPTGIDFVCSTGVYFFFYWFCVTSVLLVLLSSWGQPYLIQLIEKEKKSYVFHISN